MLLNDYSDLSLEEPANPLPEVTIEDLPERLREAVTKVNWTTLMPVQARGMQRRPAADLVAQQAGGRPHGGGRREPCRPWQQVVQRH